MRLRRIKIRNMNIQTETILVESSRNAQTLVISAADLKASRKKQRTETKKKKKHSFEGKEFAFIDGRVKRRRCDEAKLNRARNDRCRMLRKRYRTQVWFSKRGRLSPFSSFSDSDERLGSFTLEFGLSSTRCGRIKQNNQSSSCG